MLLKVLRFFFFGGQDIIQSRPSRFPIDANELFHILDDASERTFLTVGTAQSVKRYIFDGEAAKTCLEMKNLIACTSFLVEQKLVVFLLLSPLFLVNYIPMTNLLLRQYYKTGIMILVCMEGFFGPFFW